MEELVLVEEVLETVAPEAPTLAAKIVESLGVAALGMITVFAGLVILIVFITILTRFTAGGSKKKTQKASSEEKPVAAAPVAAPEPAPVDDGTPSPEVVAAISAALAVIMEGEGKKFVVRHIKRVQNASAWNRAGREEQVYSRF